MATYKGIQGYSVENLSSDPTAAEALGQLWYNSTTKSFKVSTEGAGAWSAGPSLNLARAEMGYARNATLNTGTVFGGDAPPGTSPPGYTKNTEQYDGSTWTEVADLNNGRSGFGSLGISTAAMAISGNAQPGPTSNFCETWDGTSWSEGNQVLTKRQGLYGAGTTTAGLAATGTSTADTESYDGTCWSQGKDVNNIRNAGGSCGLQTTALIFAGTPGPGKYTELWDGTCWTSVNILNAGRTQVDAGFGVPTSAMCAGGNTPGDARMAECETYDGTSWTEVGDLAVATRMGSGGGTTASGFVAGGYPANTPPTETATMEIWADPVYTIKTVTVS